MTDEQRQSVFSEYLRAASAARGNGYPIHPVAAAAQACHETGFGQHVPRNSNNVLGIKAGISWDGPIVTADTFEYYDHFRTDVPNVAWRAYPSVLRCFEDYGRIIKSLWWYEDAHAHAYGDPFDYLTALKPIYGPDGREVKEPGYFTDPAYVVSVMKIVRQFSRPLNSSGWMFVVMVRDEIHSFDIPEGYDVVERTDFQKKRKYAHIRKD